MMEMLNAGSNYIKFVDHNMHLNLNSALYSLVTPPRHNFRHFANNRLPTAVVKTPPPTKMAMEHLSKSLPKVSSSRISPSSQLDCNGFYAGAKFGERPLPTELPKPPNHWFDLTSQGSNNQHQPTCVEMTNSLKVLLKVQS